MSNILKGIKRGKKTSTFILIKSMKTVFKRLCDTFTKLLLLEHFNPKETIWLKTDALAYAIAGILS